MTVKQKLILGAILLAVLPVIIVSTIIGIQSSRSGIEALEKDAQDRLVSLRSSRKEQIESYINLLNDQIVSYAGNLMIIDAMQDFKSVFEQSGQIEDFDNAGAASSIRRYYTEDFIKEYKSRNSTAVPNMANLVSRLDKQSLNLQYHYIVNNPNPLGQKELLAGADDGSEYSTLHKKYHPSIRQFLNTFGYYDIFLVDHESGDVIYSVFKELDYTTSLIDGPFADSGLGQAFREGNQLSNAGDVAFIDYAPYLPSYEDQAMFLSTPVFSQGKKVGVLIFQAPIDKINNIMTSNKQWEQFGLGKSGETYIVGPDFRMRNDSRFLVEDKSDYIAAIQKSGMDIDTVKSIEVKNTSIGLQEISTPGARETLQGNSGFDIFPDYRGVSVLSAYTPLNVQGLGWGLLAEIDEEEAFDSAAVLSRRIFFLTLILAIAVLAIGALLSYLFVRKLVKPLENLEHTVVKVAGGDLSARANVSSNDEFGHFAGAFNNLLDDRIASFEKAERDNEALNDSVVRILQSTMPLQEKDLTASLPVSEDITGPLADSVNSVIEELCDVLVQVRSFAQRVEMGSRSVRAKSLTISEASKAERDQVEQAITNLNQLADGISKITSLTTESESFSKETTEAASKANESVDKTVESFERIQDTIHETEKRIKRLGERSQEINTIVGIIDNVAEKNPYACIERQYAGGNSRRARQRFCDYCRRSKTTCEKCTRCNRSDFQYRRKYSD